MGRSLHDSDVSREPKQASEEQTKHRPPSLCHWNHAGNQAMQARAIPPSPDAHALIERARSGPEAAPGPDLATSFGDLSDIRLHTDRSAAEATRALGVRAFTLGRDVFFSSNGYRPGTPDGRRLILHELAHAVQQRDASPGAGPPALQLHHLAERDAEAAAAGASSPTLRVDSMRVMGYPSTTARELVIMHISIWTGSLDAEALASRLFDLAWVSRDHYPYVVEVIQETPWGYRDDVSSAFVRRARDSDLDEFARTTSGRDMLRRMKSELLGGYTATHEGGEAIRLNNAIRRAEGAEEGRGRAEAALDAARDRALAEPVEIEIEPIDPSQINDRLRLLTLMLDRMRDRYVDDPELTTTIADLEAEVAFLTTGPRVDPEGDAAKIGVAQRIIERSDRSLTQLDFLLSGYRQAGPELGASQPHYIALTRRVRSAWIDALEKAFAIDAATHLALAEAEASALPRALTEVDLGVLAHRQAGYSMTEGSGVAMVEWVNWVRGRLDTFEVEARALGEARRRGEAGLEQREADFRNEADLIQLSIEGIQHWDRGLSAYEYLAGGTNLILGAYEDVAHILQRCQNMKNAALAGDLNDLRDRVKQHREDPAVEQFYKAMPLFVGMSAMLAGFAILLIAAMASAGVGALVAAPAEASMAAVATELALEALTFTVVSRGLTGMIQPAPKTPFLVDLALNFGLFAVLRVTGSAIRSALMARGLGTFVPLATHAAGYGILQAFGLLHFRIEEGRWPTGDEIAKMSVDSLIMLAGVAIASGAVRRAIMARRHLAALETFHSTYGLRLASIEIARTRLTSRFRAELQAGRGDDQTTIDALKAEAESLNEQLRILIDEVKADKNIGIEALRTALADATLRKTDVAAELLSSSLDLPRRVGLQRAGGEAQYTYEFGSTEALTERLRAMGATVTESTDTSGLKTIVAEVNGQPPMFFVERAQEFGARLAELAEIIERAGATHAERQQVIGTLRTPNDATAPGELEGFVLDTTMAENQRQIADLVQQLVTDNPDVIVGMERGGAFLADVVGAGDAALAPKVRHMPVHLDTAGNKFDGPAMVAEFMALIDKSPNARRIAIVDSYMGGTTASALRDQVLLPIARTRADVRIVVHWLREMVGKETRTAAGGVVLAPRRGTPKATQPGASQISSTERTVRLVLGDDMSIIYDPLSHEPITIFDKNGKIVSVIYPRPGQNTRELLIELLNRKPGP